MSDARGDTGDADGDGLPRPSSRRWQPLRIGLIDLFYYDDEQFWFHDGRLLLRGNNGTGKSKVLALTLPFLLDGSISARRVEPDADPKKRMEWNLLLGGTYPNSERTGYTWAEFGRVDANGNELFLTLGIGMKAAAGRGIVKTWYFVTPRRIGDLTLVDEHRTVLSHERLRDELAATAGQVYTQQQPYRRAVDEALFGLGEERYAALIDLLVQLRQPQLSKRPDEKALSAALTEALPPLDQAVVADVAESFHSLEEERTGIAETRQTLEAAEEFLRHYRVYARVAARRHTTALRLANSVYEHAGRALHETEDDLRAVLATIAQLDTEGDRSVQRRAGLQGQESALRESPEMRDAGRLERASRDADAADTRATTAADEAAQAAEHAETERTADAEAARHEKESNAAAEVCAGIATRRAADAGLGAEHAVIVADRGAADRVLVRRREQADHVRRLARDVAEARHSATSERTALDRAQAVAAERTEELQHAHDAVGVAVLGHRTEVRRFAEELTAFTIAATPDDLADLAEDWARSMDGPSPAREVVLVGARTARASISRARAAAELDERRLDVDLSTVADEIDELDAGRDPHPEPSPGRDHDARATRTGAPLWRVTDFAEDVPDGTRAAIEAALESAGLLDAWVFPDGKLETASDVVLGPAGASANPSLAEVVRAAVGPDDAIVEPAVLAVLDRIGWGEASGADLWIDGDGRWGTGPVRGMWGKPRAEFVGAGARESHRHALLASLRDRRDQIAQQLMAVREQLAEYTRRDERLDAGERAFPHAAELPLTKAHAEVAAAQRECDAAAATAFAAQLAWQRADEGATALHAALIDEAGQLRIDPSTDGADAVLSAVSLYSEALAELRAAMTAAETASKARAASAARLAAALTSQERRAGQRQETGAEAAMLRAHFDELQASVGASVAELQQQLVSIMAALDELDAEDRLRATAQLSAAAERGRLDEKARDLERRRSETGEQRVASVEALRGFADTGLLRVAAPELVVPEPDAADEWQVTAALALARAAERQLQDDRDDEDAWNRAQQRVSSASTELSTQMSRRGHTSSIEQRGDVLVARVRYVHEEIEVDRLAERLTADVADRERLLTAREREILENHLVNEVAGHLHDLLLAAEGQIDRLNHELAERKTSTGMQLRMLWNERLDAPPGLTPARRLMVRSDATWTADDRTAIGDFLQAQIARAREGNPTGGWQEHLEQALDYRQWHVFAIERRQNGQWKSASGPASGGERVLAVSVPLFAAASAHYNSADPHAPRLILLDEAFAGVDDDSRAKSLGLLATFDLDVVMTSEREWGCYPQVPGLAIAQLSRVEGVDAVGVTRWQWDGRRKREMTEVPIAARASDQTTDAPDAPGLF